MHFSTEQEAALIEENMKKIYRAVDNFCCRCHGSTVRVDYDEFVSEVSIVFLKHLRKCETMEEINKFPWYDALNAMTRLVMAYQPLSGPKTAKHFSRLVSRMPATVSIDLAVANGIEVDGMSHFWVEDKETQIDFDTFMDDHGEDMNRIAGMKLLGATNRKIAGQFGVDASSISRRLTALRKDYDEFFREDDES